MLYRKLGQMDKTVSIRVSVSCGFKRHWYCHHRAYSRRMPRQTFPPKSRRSEILQDKAKPCEIKAYAISAINLK